MTTDTNLWETSWNNLQIMATTRRPLENPAPYGQAFEDV